MNNGIDKAGEKYWSSFWEQLELPIAIDISEKSFNNYEYRNYHIKFKKLFPNDDFRGKKLIELGCGNSTFMSYFTSEFGFSVSGLDYSEYGCEQTRKILKRDGVTASVVQGDIFNPPAELIGNFDVVCSFGVAEHFEDTKAVLVAMSKFLKPGGLLITTVPNLQGATGFLQKLMNKPVFDIHVVMSKDDLARQIVNAGLELVSAQYFIPVSFGVTLEKHEGQEIKFLRLKKIILKCFQVTEKIFWWVDDHLFKIPCNRYFTSGIFTVGRMPKPTT